MLTEEELIELGFEEYRNPFSTTLEKCFSKGPKILCDVGSDMMLLPRFVYHTDKQKLTDRKISYTKNFTNKETAYSDMLKYIFALELLEPNEKV